MSARRSLPLPRRACRFGGRAGLPIHVVDEDIYDSRPSIVIGTVDKFAMMAWRPDARALFGLDDDGERDVSPPGLIIQDELHLISGPLGSMVGLYEPIIEDLCTDVGATAGPAEDHRIDCDDPALRRTDSWPVRARRGRAVPAAWARGGAILLRRARHLADGELAPGRRYLGVMSASLGSMQTVQVRVAAATLQGATEIPEADRDGYWTNLNFLNSLRELGNTVSLLQSDIPDYLTGLRRRDGLDAALAAHHDGTDLAGGEATRSRRRSSNSRSHYRPDARLRRHLPGIQHHRGRRRHRPARPHDDRWPAQDHRAVHPGQRPRRPSADGSPGLVITIYGAAKPRDRSHYERFRTYHQQLYAQVEPTSVTPFAAPVLRRALHAAACRHIRQTSAPDLRSYPFPKAEYDDADRAAPRRAPHSPTATKCQSLERMQRKRARRVGEAGTERSGAPTSSAATRSRASCATPARCLTSKARPPCGTSPRSMRNVDAECRLEIILAYIHDDVAAR